MKSAGTVKPAKTPVMFALVPAIVANARSFSGNQLVVTRAGTL